MVLSTMYTPSGVVAAAVVTGAAELVEPAVVTGAAALVFSGLDVVIGDPTPDAGTPLPADPRIPQAPAASQPPAAKLMTSTWRLTCRVVSDRCR